MNTILKYVFYAVIVVIIYLVGRGIYESNVSKQNSDAQTIDRINPNVQSRASDNQKTGQNDQQGELKMSQNDLNNDVWEKTKETSNDAWETTKEGSAKAWDKTKEVSSDAWEATKEGSAKAWDKTKEVSSDAWEATKEGAAKVGDAVSDTADKAVAPTDAPAYNPQTGNRPAQPENRTY